ncbi:SusE domain-containing protein [Aestuariivivens sediminicola]|uniref:SusE domain-containing protein n=1 Tax=Aestuariivivens sediminicola TaxID=2913560 RepID=UPI001F57E37C|nr:SusE domain-containing protein [Aestuariivivens sediminicola]
MKKNITYLSLLIIALLSFNSCDQEDDLVFTAVEPVEGVSFSNSFSEEYILNKNASGNLGERFTWEDAYFGVPTNVSYELENSILGDFTDATTVGTTDGNELAVTIGQMLAFATAAGLDDDPDTPEPNMGKLYFRLKAFVGTEGLETYSGVQELNITIPEIIVGGGAFEISSWGVVGSGYNNWGAFEDSPFYTTADAGILAAYVTLVDGEIKFRENNDWANNFGDTGNDGVLDAGGDNIAVTAGTYKITFNTNDNTYTIDPYSWGVVGSGYNDWGGAGPDAKFYYDYSTDTFKVSVQLLNGEIKFRLNNDWGTNFGDTGADGTLDAGGDNIASTAGYYNITLDFNANSFTMEAANVLGIVGSGYNDWGGAGPDFSITQVRPDEYEGDIVTLVDGEIKFRVNNAWDTNYGDTGADGTLDAGGDNIAVTAGAYRVKLNLADGSYALNQVQ